MTQGAATATAFAGNAAAMRTLRAALTAGRLPHAHLFTGPPQVGKGTLARWLAQTLLCQSPPQGDPAPCGACGACVRIAHGTHPDVQTFGLERQARESDRATASRELGIDTVRAIVGEIDLLPFEARRKVYVVEDADTLTEEAANGLLKTLEEPPAYATLVLLAVEDRALPDTIRSRCAPLRLHAVPTREIEALLRARTSLPPEDAARVAALAQGRPGWALEAAADPAVLERHDANLDALLEALRGGVAARLALAERLAKRWTAGHRQEVYAALYDWLGFWRGAMLVTAGAANGSIDAKYRAEMEKRAGDSVDGAGRAAARTLEAIAQLDANVNTRMAVETLLLDLP